MCGGRRLVSAAPSLPSRRQGARTPDSCFGGGGEPGPATSQVRPRWPAARAMCLRPRAPLVRPSSCGQRKRPGQDKEAGRASEAAPLTHQSEAEAMAEASLAVYTGAALGAAR